MAPSYIAAAATLLVGVFSLFGKQIDVSNAQTLIEAVILVGGPLIVMFRQWITGRSTLLGIRPQ